jgi:hypothetical protein
MIIPTIGRVMWYWPEKQYRGDQPWVALVSFVHDANVVNLAVFRPNGSIDGGKTAVPVVQDGSPHIAGDRPYVEWMPYQKAVASGKVAPTLHAQAKKDK